ncbi:phage protein [Streptococcus suis]|uniref:DUF1642 domain-containing protein n=1 Tax=Streptococcus suis TaxID=1307 RepID=UPI000695F50A|nr:DUF1642 domain-containing protein [Streptococcus suis]NQI18303.1 DUF1642 domain-containing protein [Streptococcus suis]NQP01274.1 DUF1642 domain-containing protein [Streptococcus suis]CYU40375.1 phage protein [Streptococcus suis]HEM5466056.1 DUF1642 domain-containing protein [Streptococcus suis]
MNKQEAIEIIEQDKIQVGRLVETNSGAHSIQQKVKLVDYVPLEIVVNTIDKIGLKKVVVPAFIDSYIRYAKAEGMSLFIAMDNAQNKESEWIIMNEETFARAWYYGYEIEQEKLYTVEIAEVILTKITRRSNVQYKMLPFGNVSDVFDKAIYTTRLTEQEIKQKDERLWQFAKEVGR